jgi:hypothetical protein
MPIIRHDSPYYTSLSLMAWPIAMGMVYFVLVGSGWLLDWTDLGPRRAKRLFKRAKYYYKALSQGMQKTAEETAFNAPSERDTRVFMWTYESLDEDDDLERFFAGLPGLCRSKVVAEPLPRLFGDQIDRMSNIEIAFDGLLDRTLSSDLLSESVKKRRAMILAKALDLKYFYTAFSILKRILSEFRFSGPLATGVAEILRGWRNDQDEGTVLKAQAIISEIVAIMQPRDDSWFILASKELGVPETVLRDYATHGDSLSLAILIYVVRQQFNNIRNSSWSHFEFSSALEAASKFDARSRDTSSELQHEFCALWNQIVRKCQNDDDHRMAWYILMQIRNVYLALHQDTNSAPIQFDASTDDSSHILGDPFSYPVCNLPGHHPDSTPHIYDDSAPTTSARIVLSRLDNPALIPSFLARRPGSTSSPVHAPHRIDGSIDAPHPDEIISPSSQTVFESRRFHLSTPEPSASPLQDFVAAEDNATGHTTSPTPVPDDVLPTCLSFP